MSRGDQLSRQWQIIQSIAASQAGHTAKELAAAIGASPRTVYRDLEALQTAGFPIYGDRDQGRNVWKLLEGTRNHIPAPFTLNELMALYFCGDMIKFLRDTLFYDSLDSLFKKIKATLPPQSMEYLQNLQKTFTVGKKHYKPYGSLSQIIHCATNAALQRRTLEIVHRAMGARTAMKRRVNPYRIWFFNGTFYLIGHCHLRDEVRIFACDRIRTLEMTADTFDVPDDFDFDDMMKGSFGAFTGTPRSIRVRFDKKIAGYVRERVWHATQKLIPQRDGGISFEAHVAINDELKSWLMSWGSSVQVLHPAELIETIREDAARIVSRYTPDNPPG